MIVAEIEARIRAAVEAQRAKGVRIIYGSFGRVAGGCLCPIGCLNETESPGSAGDPLVMAANRLGIGLEDAWEFVHGFDSIDRRTGHDLYALGAKLRAEYLP